MQITRHTVVSVDYTLTDDAGAVLDTSRGAEPLAYIHGVGQVVPGLERALDGHVAGDRVQVRIEPADAYGERDERLMHRAERSQFGAEPPEVGMRVEASSPEGKHLLTIVAVDGDVVTLDGNHPLAGVPLTFDVTIVDVRAATRQEIEHGHAHGPGDAHH
jgi:FKBP-type peptidyl-prolyl cis-trans isomerase SlyD